MVKMVSDLNCEGNWVNSDVEVDAINDALGLNFINYFVVAPEDGGRSGQYEVYAIDGYIPYSYKRLWGPFKYPA